VKSHSWVFWVFFVQVVVGVMALRSAPDEHYEILVRGFVGGICFTGMTVMIALTLATWQGG